MGKVIRERDVEKYLVKCVKKLGGGIRKVKWIGRRNAPDRLAAVPHILPPTFVEVKRPGERPTLAQLREHKRMRSIGINVTWVSSFDDVDNLIKYGV